MLLEGRGAPGFSTSRSAAAVPLSRAHDEDCMIQMSRQDIEEQEASFFELGLSVLFLDCLQIT